MKDFKSYIKRLFGYQSGTVYQENKILKYSHVDDDYIYYHFYDSPIYLRKNGSSDYLVLKQILINKEYGPVASFFTSNGFVPQIMIDAGANIGLTSIYFKQLFKDLKIICIEPEENNFKMLERNTQAFLEDGSIKLFKAGLMGKSGIPLKISSDFRDGKDWAKQTIISEDQDVKIKSISIQELIASQKLSSIDLMKIDIEGGETFLIQPDTDTSFLKITKIIAIEIHDEYNCKEDIYDLLRRNNFLLIEISETTIGINKNFLE